MKIRNGFVSNSSSQSFTIQKSGLTEEIIAKVADHLNYTIENLESDYDIYGIKASHLDPIEDKWTVINNVETITISCSNNNFAMGKFLLLIGIDKNDITWSGGPL